LPAEVVHASANQVASRDAAHRAAEPASSRLDRKRRQAKSYSPVVQCAVGCALIARKCLVNDPAPNALKRIARIPAQEPLTLSHVLSPATNLR
jgi:hypothetical protein